MRKIDWRDILVRLPLPTLALAAAYGVYRFQAFFTPWYIALVSAASFELVYLGISVAQLQDGSKHRAMLVSRFAVFVSVIYNSLAALFEVRPTILVDRPLWGDIILAALHGAPLAIVAYAVSDLLLHTERTKETPVSELDTLHEQIADMQNELTHVYEIVSSDVSDEEINDTPDTLSVSDEEINDTPDTHDEITPLQLARQLRESGKSWREVAQAVGMSDATLRRRLAVIDKTA